MIVVRRYIPVMEQGNQPGPPAPEWEVERWLNSDEPVRLAGLRGRVVLGVAFQMLCPGCVAQALPQAQRAAAAFAPADLVVLGLHSVFEHEEAQGSAAALSAFLHEYRIGFPVAIDARHEDERLPATMRTYAMRGTPTMLLIDREGRLRLDHFGHLDDMRLGAAIATLIAEAAGVPVSPVGSEGATCRI